MSLWWDISFTRAARSRGVKVVARIRTGFKTKFGIPRQSGLVKGLRGKIVFEPEFRNPEALRGLEGYDYLWLLWDFSEAHRDGQWSPTVRPPRLGGNKRIGVWATRSPFRPNNIGLSSVKIYSIDLNTSEGPVIEVEGVDLMDGTPIYDIKPYLPFTDSHPDAKAGFAEEQNRILQPKEVVLPFGKVSVLSREQQETLCGILAEDPRPHYQQDPERVYALEFCGREIKFQVRGDKVFVLDL